MVVTPSKDDLEDRRIYDSFMSELLDKMPRGDLPTRLRDFHNRVIVVVGAESFEEWETRKSIWDPLLQDMRNFPLLSTERTALEDVIEKIEPWPYSKILRSICLKSGFSLENVRFYAKWSDFLNDSSCNPDIIFFDGHGYSVPITSDGKSHISYHISYGYDDDTGPKHPIEEITHPIEEIFQGINEKKGSIFLIVLPICFSTQLAKVLRRSDNVKYVFGPDDDLISPEDQYYRWDSILRLFEKLFA
jgi:hypothetical protein